MHHTLGYLKELCDDCRSNYFSLVQQVKKGTIKTFKGELDFFSSATFVGVHYSVLNPCEYSDAVLKGKRFCEQINGLEWT